MRFDKACELLAAIHAGRISSGAEAARIFGKDPATIWRWVDSLRTFGVTLRTNKPGEPARPWKITAWGQFQKPRRKGK